MSTIVSENKQLVRQCVNEVLCQGNFDHMEEYFADDYVEHTTASPEDLEGLEAVREHYVEIREAFPDFNVEIQELIAEEDKVIQRSRQTGTHEGEFIDIEPTGNTVDSQGIVLYRIEDDQIAEAWVQANMMGMMQQLGIIEAPGE